MFVRCHKERAVSFRPMGGKVIILDRAYGLLKICSIIGYDQKNMHCD